METRPFFGSFYEDNGKNSVTCGTYDCPFYRSRRGGFTEHTLGEGTDQVSIAPDAKQEKPLHIYCCAAETRRKKVLIDRQRHEGGTCTVSDA